MDLYEELVRLTRELDAAGIPYGLVGALALAAHGVPRATADIDLLMRAEHVASALAAAARVGYSHRALPMTFRDQTTLHRVTRLGDKDALTLDLIVLNKDQEDIWRSIEVLQTEDGPLRVVSREALIQMKLAAGRPQDLADVERLVEQDR